MIAYAALTACGQVRRTNQDAFLADGLIGVGARATHRGLAGLSAENAYVFAVVDGMGGHQGGEDAAAMVAVELAHLDWTVFPEQADSVMERLSDKIFRAGVGLGTPTMGAAVAVLIVTEHHTVVANVGDCRAYKVAGGYLGQLSVDDRNLGGAANVLTQSLGGEPRVLDSHALRERIGTEPVTRYLLCSDGIHGFIDPAELKASLVEEATPAEAVDRLAGAVADVSQDNYTAVVFDVTQP